MHNFNHKPIVDYQKKKIKNRSIFLIFSSGSALAIDMYRASSFENDNAMSSEFTIAVPWIKPSRVMDSHTL